MRELSTETRWRYFQHPTTQSVARVHPSDKGKAGVYLRWGWEERPR